MAFNCSDAVLCYLFIEVVLQWRPTIAASAWGGPHVGIDVLVLVHAVLLGGRPVVGASCQLSGGKASYWRMAFRLVFNEIAALVGLATKRRRPPVPERYASQVAVMVTTVRKGAP